MGFYRRVKYFILHAAKIFLPAYLAILIGTKEHTVSVRTTKKTLSPTSQQKTVMCFYNPKPIINVPADVSFLKSRYLPTKSNWKQEEQGK